MQRNHLTSGKGSLNQKCPGISWSNNLSPLEALVVKTPASLSESLIKIFLDVNSGSSLLMEPHLVSLPLSGNIFLGESQSSSTISSPLSTALQLMKRGRHALETQKSLLVSLMQSIKLALPPNGLPHGILQQEPLHSFFPIEQRNYGPMVTTLKENSLRNSQPLTQKSSFSTLRCVTWSKEDSPYSLQTNNTSFDFTLLSLCPTELNPIQERAPIDNQISHVSMEANQTFATDSTVAMDASSPTPIASTNTPARTARKLGMGKNSAPTKRYCDILGLQPKYLQYNIWSSFPRCTRTIVDWSETAISLP